MRSPVASGGWDEPLDPAYEDEPDFVVEIDDVLKEIVPMAVELTKVFYLEHPKLGVWQVAERCRKTYQFSLLTIRGVCALVESRISE